jgi:hypothetical protein
MVSLKLFLFWADLRSWVLLDNASASLLARFSPSCALRWLSGGEGHAFFFFATAYGVAARVFG